jgi:hypothetical protein
MKTLSELRRESHATTEDFVSFSIYAKGKKSAEMVLAHHGDKTIPIAFQPNHPGDEFAVWMDSFSLPHSMLAKYQVEIRNLIDDLEAAAAKTRWEESQVKA